MEGRREQGAGGREEAMMRVREGARENRRWGGQRGEGGRGERGGRRREQGDGGRGNKGREGEEEGGSEGAR